MLGLSVHIYVYTVYVGCVNMCLRQTYTLINPPDVKCVVLVLGAKIQIFKEGSTLYMGARISKFLWLLGINEKLIHFYS